MKEGENSYKNQNGLDTKIEKNPKFFNKCSALLQKNFKRLSRNWIQLVFFILFPTIQFGILLYSIGDKPVDLNLAVFNEELTNNVTHGWGQMFVESIDKNTFNIMRFESFERALESVKRGRTYAVIDINDRFTKALKLRAVYGREADEELLKESQIRVHIDWSNQMIALQIERHLYEAITRFAEEVANKTDTNPDSIRIPLTFEGPVYGVRTESLRDFVLPGSFILIVFFATTTVTANLILEERKDGSLERSLVAGVKALDFLLSHALTQFLILCLQIIFLSFVPYFFFDRQMSASFILMIALALSQGFCGISFGLMVAAVCSELLYATMFVTSSLLIGMSVSGLFWPIENMPLLIQYSGQLTPFSFPIHSLRCILYREWTLTYFEVYMGFVITYVWIALFLIIALIFLRKGY